MVKPKDNPFRISNIHALPFLFEGDQKETFYTALRTHRYSGAIVGPHGSGKSTLLAECTRLLETAGRTVITVGKEDGRPHRVASYTELSTQDIRDSFVCIDGLECLGRFYGRKLKQIQRRSRGVLITTHIPILLPTLHECFPSPVVLARLMAELLHTDVKELIPLSILLHRYHRGNIRAAFFELYDLWSRGIRVGERGNGYRFSTQERKKIIPG